jgi:rSAM/selenodomain-associated transferase 2
LSISVIIPALNEAAQIESTLRFARDPNASEIIVVDGGSRDQTPALARLWADRVIDAPAGRASQMNAGARKATGSVLLFLHADTLLPGGWGDRVEAAIGAGAIAGRFDVTLGGASPLLRIVGWAMNLRSRWTGIATGDQAIFVRRDVFERIGGYPELPLLEDIALTSALRRIGRTAALRERVVTSARRWEKHGPLRTIALMWWIRLAYFLGVPPDRLARRYARHDEPGRRAGSARPVGGGRAG